MKIHSLGYIGIKSTNPSSWIDYGKEVLGMQHVTGKAGGSKLENGVYLKMDDRPFRIIVEPSGTDSYGFSAWEVAGPDAFTDAIKTLEKHKIEFKRADGQLIDKRRVQDLLSFSDPDGNEHELYWGPISDFAPFASPKGIAGFVTGSQGFGHTVLPAPNFDETLAFYQDVMGFQLSDLMKVRLTPDENEPEKRLYFMHCNERHHSLAIMEMASPVKCIHLMVEVDSVDEVGRALDRMKANGVQLTGTLGRHANDHMLSFYMATPSGFMLEYGAEGLSVKDWGQYSPFQSTVNSFWGHDFSVGQS